MVNYNTTAEEEKRKSRQRYAQYKAETTKDQPRTFDMEGYKKDRETRAQRVSDYYKNKMAGNVDVPQKVSNAKENYMRLSDQAKGLSYAYGQARLDGSNAETNQKVANLEKQIASKSGLQGNALQKQLNGATDMAKFNKKVKDGLGYKNLSDNEKLEYAYNSLFALPEDQQNFLKNYSSNYSKTANFFLSPAQKLPDNIEDVDNIIDTNPVAALKNFGSKAQAQKLFGWTPEQTDAYMDMSKRVQNYEDQQRLNASAAIDPNSQNKFEQGLRNTVSVLGQPLANIATMGANVEGIGNALGYDPNSAWNRAFNYKNELQNQVSQNAIGDDHKVGQFFYNAGMSGADSLEQIALTGGLGKYASLVPFFAGAFTQQRQGAKQRGLTDEQATAEAFASGAAEAITELIPLENFWKLTKGGTAKIGKEAIKGILKQGAEEGAEEALSDVLNLISDQLISDEGQSSMDLSIKEYMKTMPEEEARKRAYLDFVNQTLYDFAAGATSGMAIGAGGTAVGVHNTRQMQQDTQAKYAKYAQEVNADTEYGKAKKAQYEAYSKNAIKSYADQIDDSTKAGKEIRAELNQLAAKVDEGKKLSFNDQVRFNEIMERAESVTISEDTRDLARKERLAEAVVPEQYRTAVTGITEEQARKQLVEAANEGNVDKIDNIHKLMKNSTSAEVRAEADNILNDYEKMAKGKGVSSEQWDAIKTMSASDAYMKGIHGESIEGVASNFAKEAYNAGVQQRTQDYANTIKKISEHKATDSAKLAYVENANNTIGLYQYDRAFDNIYNNAVVGNEFDANSKEAILLGEEAAKRIYEVGRADYGAEIQKEARDYVDKVLDFEKTHDAITKGSGTFQDIRKRKNSNVDTSLMNFVANVTGLNVVLGDKAKNSIQASFTVSNSTIFVTEDHASQLIHELGEFASFYASKEYEDVRAAAMGASKSILGDVKFNRALNNYHDTYLKFNPNQTILESSSEMANDYLVSLMSSDKGQKALADYLAKNYTAEEAMEKGSKIKEFFQKIVDSVKSFLGVSKLNSYQRDYLTKQLDVDQKNIDMFIKTLDKAIKNYTNLQRAEGTTIASTDGVRRLSVATYEDQGKVLLEKYLEEQSGLSEEDQQDIIDQLDWGYKIAKEMMGSKELESFGKWSNTGLSVAPDGTPYLEMYNAEGRPIKSVVVNNGEYPLNIDFSQVCKKRVALNTVLNKLVADADLNLNVLTESDINDINSLIKQHGFEIACGLCFVDSKRYRIGDWSNSFVEGKFNKNGIKYQGGWNDLIKSLLPKGVSAEHFNFATTHETPVGTLLSEIPEDQLNWKKIDKMLDGYVKEDGTLGQKIQNGKNKNPTELVRMAYLIKNNPECRKLMDKNDIIASEGLDTIREQNYDLYKIVNAHWGAGKPKLSHGYTAYGNDILRSKDWKGSKNDFNPDNSWSVGGVRVQSFSDYVANMFFDYMQMFADMSARKLPSHAYTKEVDYVKIFGLTGQKINMSLVPRAAKLTPEQIEKYNRLGGNGKRINVNKILNDPEFKALAEHAGLDENGDYIWEDETFPFDEAMKLRSQDGYKDNCGTIAVGVSDAHIRKLLADPRIDMVIPYHSSGVSQLIKKERNIALYKDYQSVQNTLNENGNAMKNDHFDWYGILKSENNPNGLEAREAAEEYKKYCKKNGYTPKFNDFVNEPNYYKLLIDFRAYDENGNFQQQNAVKAQYPADLKEIVQKSLKAQQKTEDKMDVEMSDEQSSLYNEVKNVLRDKGTLYSLDVDSDGNNLTEDQAKYFKDSTIRDENGKLKVMYHGTKENFTVFDPMKLGGLNGTAEGYGLYFADTQEVSNAYGNNVMKGYLNITKPARFDQKKIKQNDLAKLVKATCEKEAQSLMEDGYDSIKDAIKDTWISNYVDTYGMSIDQAYREVAKSILNMNDNDMHVVQEVMAGMAIRSYASAYEFYDTLTDTLGIDGFIAEWEDTSTGDKTEVAVALYSNQFKNIDNQNPTSNPDIRYSVKLDEESGVEYVEVDTDQKRLEGLDESALLKEVRTILKEFLHANNKVLGSIDDTTITGNHDLVSHYAGAARSQYKKDNRSEAKFRATTELLNLIKVSVFDNHKTFEDIQKNTPGKHLEAIKGITQYKTLFHVLDNYYVGYLNVLNRKYDRVLYDITKIRKIVKGDIAATMSRVAVTDPSYNEMVTYYQNKGKKFSLDVDSDLMDDAFVESLIDDDLDGLFTEEEQKLFDNPKWTLSDLISTLLDEIEKAPEKKRKEAVKHLTRKALGDQFKANGKTVSFTDERIDSYLKQFASTNKDYAQAYITYMSPADFILLTANGNKGSQYFDHLMEESHDFNPDEFSDALKYQPMFLDIDESNKITKVVGHEGRHRMIALQLAGYTKVPVLLFDYDNKYSKEYISSMRLKPQDFTGDSNYNKSNEIILNDIEPLSTGNAENVKAKFGSSADSDIMFSMNVDTEGNNLTENQQKYFADSKVRDDNGALKVMYHGARGVGFTTFDPRFSDDERSLFFTDSNEVASTYSGTHELFTPDKPMTYSELSQMISDYAGDYYLDKINGDVVIREYGMIGDEDPIVYQGDVKGAQDYFMSSLGDLSSDMDANYQVYLNLTNPLVIDANGSEWDEIEFNGSKTTTREISKYAQENGYDGVIFKDMYDIGLYASSKQYQTSTVAIAFNPDQIKSVWNTNPTENEDIRYSLDLEEDEWELFEGAKPSVNNASILEEGLKALKGKEVNTRAISKIANELKNEFASTIDKKQFTDMLNRAFSYLHTRDNITFNDVMSIFEEVARPVIDQSTKVENADLYNEFTDSFKGRKIKLTQKQLAEVKSTYGSYAAFQKAMYPLTFSLNGETKLDEMWYGLAEAYPGLVEYDTNEGDMPMALNDLIEALRPSPVNTFGGDAEEVAKDLAMRIVESYLGTESDAKVKKAAEQMKNANKEYRAKVRERYRDKLAKAKEDMQLKVREAKYNERWKGAENAQKIAEIKAKSKDKMTNYKDRQNAKKQKQMISQLVNDLSTRIMNPTEKKHVPQSMIKPLMDFLQTINFVEPQVKYDAKDKLYKITMLDYNEKVDGVNHNHMLTLTGKTSTEVIQKFYDELNAGKGSQNQKRWQEKLSAIKDLFLKSTNLDGDAGDVINMLDATMADSLVDLLERNDHLLSINNLNTNDLIIVKNALRNITKAINDQNKAFTMRPDIDEIAHGIQKHGEGLRKDRTSAYIKMHDLLVMNMLAPDTYFTMLGEKGVEIEKALQGALDKKIGFVQKASEFMQKTIEGIDKRIIRDWSGEKATVHTFDTAEGQIKMTTAQIMGLYELSKRQQAMIHMAGGVTVENIKIGWKKLNFIQNRGIHLTMDELSNILSTLTADQIRIADAMQQYMATECANQGNEASMTMYGFEKYLDENYYPITTAKDSNNADNIGEVANTLNGIERMGFTKAVTKDASNPIVIRDIFDVFVEHTTNMATYSAYAPVIKDAIRIYNFKDIEKVDGNKYYMSVRQAMDACMGRSDQAGSKYFETLIRDINGKERAKTLKTGAEMLAGSYKAAAVGGNLRVVVQQPTAFIRAGVVIDPKYLAQATPKVFTNVKRMEELKSKVPLIFWKSQGYYETDIGRSEKEIITGVDSVRERVTEASMWLAGKADDITWATLYDAAERQIKAENPGLKGDEFDAKVVELFNKAIHETQVVDATIMKAPWLRMNDTGLKLMASFMAEPIKSYNVGLKAIIQAERGEVPKKVATYAIGTLVATDVVNALAQSLIDAIRYHDDDDEYYEEVLDYWFKNFIDNVLPYKRIPFINDAIDMLVPAIKGESSYGSTNGQMMEYAALQTFTNAITTASKQIQGTYNKTNYAAFTDYVKALSQMSGMPLYNIQRDAIAVWNMFAPSDLDLKKQVEKPTDKYNNIISVLDKDRSDEVLDEAVKKVMEKDGTIKDVESKIVSAYKQDYLEALANDDAISEEIFETAVRGYMAIGLSRVDAEAEVESWADVEVGYSDLDKAIMSGDGIELATKIVMKNKDTDKILDHIDNSFGGTIEFNRSKGYQSDIESNVNQVLQMVDGIDYDGLVRLNEQKALEKQQKAEQAAANKAAREAKEQLKTNLYSSIDTGSDYKSAVDEMVKSGVEYKDVKSAITDKYKSEFVEAYNLGNMQKATQIKQRVATVKAYCDSQTGVKIAKKWNGDYYAYELDHVDEWLK